MSADRTETSLHRALADDRRREIVELLGAARSGCDVAELAARLELHPNTIRWHLGILADAGVVDSYPAGRGSPGRPRIVYTLRRAAIDRGREEYRLLATMLAATVAGEPAGGTRAEAAGRVWGGYLVRRAPPGMRVPEEESVAEIARILDEQGFAPEVDGGELRMRRCPFHELAEQYPSVVCATHRGLIAGALGELRSPLRVGELRPFAAPGVCTVRLEPVRARSSATAPCSRSR